MHWHYRSINNGTINLCPLNLFLKEEAARCAMRLKVLGYFKSRNLGHSNILKVVKMESHTAFDLTKCRLIFDREFHTTIPSRAEWEENTVTSSNYLEMYTDGSKTEAGTGSGVYCQQLDINSSIKLPNECTVFQAKMLAIKVAVSTLLSLNTLGRAISIYVDSQAAIKALEGTRVRSTLVLETIKELNSLGRTNRVRICWVPGHANHAGNEKADELARTASASEQEIIRDVLPPFAWFKNRLRMETNKSWETTWSSGATCRVSKLFWPCLSTRKVKGILGLPRKTLSTLVGYLTGHCLLGKQARRLGLTTNDNCRFCEDLSVEEDVIHLICECHALGRRRFRILGKPFIQEEELCEIGERDILKFFSHISL